MSWDNGSSLTYFIGDDEIRLLYRLTSPGLTRSSRPNATGKKRHCPRRAAWRRRSENQGSCAFYRVPNAIVAPIVSVTLPSRATATSAHAAGGAPVELCDPRIMPAMADTDPQYPLYLYEFRYRCERTGKWRKARHCAEVAVIRERNAEFQIEGEPMIIREPSTGTFNPFRSRQSDLPSVSPSAQHFDGLHDGCA